MILSGLVPSIEYIHATLWLTAKHAGRKLTDLQVSLKHLRPCDNLFAVCSEPPSDTLPPTYALPVRILMERQRSSRPMSLVAMMQVALTEVCKQHC